MKHHKQLKPETADIARHIRIAFVVSEHTPAQSSQLLSLNQKFLTDQGFTHVDTFCVPGIFELPSMTSLILDKGIYNVIIILGVISQEATPACESLMSGCVQGISHLMTHYDTPVVFGVLTGKDATTIQDHIDVSSSIAALNYITQRSTAEGLLEHRHQELMQQAGEILQDIT